MNKICYVVCMKNNENYYFHNRVNALKFAHYVQNVDCICEILANYDGIKYND